MGENPFKIGDLVRCGEHDRQEYAHGRRKERGWRFINDIGIITDINPFGSCKIRFQVTGITFWLNWKRLEGISR
jgi:hypothetical protein